MSRNFGLGSRNMGFAGKIALDNAAHQRCVSFSTADTYYDRWNLFSEWAKINDIKKMENISYELVTKYGHELAERVIAGEIAESTAQNYLSAINSVMKIATKGEWQSVFPTKNCQIPKRSGIRQDVPGGLDREVYSRAVKAVREQVSERSGAVVELARELGLRSKEASLLDSRALLAEAKKRGAITIRSGTKGGRGRKVLITSETQIQALEHAAQAQGGDRSMIPSNQSWKKWRGGELRKARELVQKHTKGGLHDLRAAHACQRYQELTGHAPPCAGGKITDKGRDAMARLVVAQELGHGRAEVAAEYVGGRS